MIIIKIIITRKELLFDFERVFRRVCLRGFVGCKDTVDVLSK